MARTSVKILFMSFLIAMGGLVLLITGRRSEGPNNPFAGMDKAGTFILLCGGLMFVLGLFWLRRD